mmetsp:Transcript_7075/g.17849  ORF Transcript_7075/g.17849 Transcript_7075/m.17849 type:complete len:236 (+) Transcript_7075:1205-1912(+)
MLEHGRRHRPAAGVGLFPQGEDAVALVATGRKEARAQSGPGRLGARVRPRSYRRRLQCQRGTGSTPAAPNTPRRRGCERARVRWHRGRHLDARQDIHRVLCALAPLMRLAGDLLLQRLLLIIETLKKLRFVRLEAHVRIRVGLAALLVAAHLPVHPRAPVLLQRDRLLEDADCRRPVSPRQILGCLVHINGVHNRCALRLARGFVDVLGDVLARVSARVVALHEGLGADQVARRH